MLARCFSQEPPETSSFAIFDMSACRIVTPELPDVSGFHAAVAVVPKRNFLHRNRSSVRKFGGEAGIELYGSILTRTLTISRYPIPYRNLARAFDKYFYLAAYLRID